MILQEKQFLVIFEKIANGQLDRLYDNKLAENFEQSLNIYNKSLSKKKRKL